MRKQLIPVVMLVTASLAVATYAVTSRVSADRPDCPGKIVCPLTGEQVCRDHCSRVDPNRPDCPGQIECPLTGKLVCRDRCPLHKGERTAAQDVPSCCRGGK